MTTREFIKKFLKEKGYIINFIPFINSIRILSGNLLDIKKTMFRCRIKCKGKNNEIIFKNGGILRNCNININGDNNRVLLGNNVSIIKGTIWIEDSNNSIIIGANSSLCGEILLAACEGTSIELGEDVLCSSKIELRTSDSHSILDVSGERINPAKNIKIGSHVWIGEGVRITKGAETGDNTVIGTATVLNKVFTQDNVIIAGIPGKICKENINWSRYRY